MQPNPNELLKDFKQVALLAGVEISDQSIEFSYLSAPHTPPTKLPKGKMAIYVFFNENETLKIGKVGPKSQARFTSQHYNPASSNSNLAKSLLNDITQTELIKLQDMTIGMWIKQNVSRINFLVDEKLGIPVLSLFEVFLQCRLSPKYEGFLGQRI